MVILYSMAVGHSIYATMIFYGVGASQLAVVCKFNGSLKPAQYGLKCKPIFGPGCCGDARPE